MKLCATFEMKPSTWTPRSLHTNSRIHDIKTDCMTSEMYTLMRLAHRMNRRKFSSLHLDEVPILQYDIRVTFQRRVMAYAVVNRHTSRKSDTWEEKTVNEGVLKHTLRWRQMKHSFYLSSYLFPSWRFFQSLPWWRHLPFHTGWGRRFQLQLQQQLSSEPLQVKIKRSHCKIKLWKINPDVWPDNTDMQNAVAVLLWPFRWYNSFHVSQLLLHFHSCCPGRRSSHGMFSSQI